MARKIKYTWLRSKVAEYCFRNGNTVAGVARKIGYKRQQIEAAMSSKMPISHGLAVGLSRLIDADFEVIQMTDGTLPPKLLKKCALYPGEILEAIYDAVLKLDKINSLK